MMTSQVAVPIDRLLTQYKNEPKLTIELLDTESENSNEDPADYERVSEYVQTLAGDNIQPDLLPHMAGRPIYLSR